MNLNTLTKRLLGGPFDSSRQALRIYLSVQSKATHASFLRVRDPSLEMVR